MGWIPTDASTPPFPVPRMPMCDETRFVDNRIITVDLDPETERNIRADERNAVLDMIEEHLGHTPHLASLLDFLSRLRPGTPPGD